MEEKISQKDINKMMNRGSRRGKDTFDPVHNNAVARRNFRTRTTFNRAKKKGIIAKNRDIYGRKTVGGSRQNW